MKLSANFSRLLEGFFTGRLMRQRDASPHTIATYRDTFCLLLRFAQQHLRKTPSALTLADIDAPFVGAFLDHLEKNRRNTIRSRNCRLAAIRSLFRYAALHEPDHSALIQRVLAVPSKRYDRTEVEFLTHEEIDALLAAPDVSTWSGRRDRTLLHLAVQTGLRVSELVGLRWQDVVLSDGAHVHCHGKGRKERCTPVHKEVVRELGNWFRELNPQPCDPVFPSMRGGPLGPDGVQHLLAKHLATAQPASGALLYKGNASHPTSCDTVPQWSCFWPAWIRL